ncbi:MAG: alkaline phosphatase D family protein, partial [Candidatus Limnocylindrales bacterium]
TTGPDPDQWDSYPAERAAIFDAMRASGSSVVVLSGDIHAAIASELSPDPFGGTAEPVAVEFVTTSLTSQNLDDKMGWAPRTQSVAIEAELLAGWPHMRMCDLDSHGYVVLDVTPERVVAEWWFVDTVLRRTSVERLGGAWQVEHGRPTLLAR